jgi:hypothetical protein
MPKATVNQDRETTGWEGNINNDTTISSGDHQ